MQRSWVTCLIDGLHLVVVVCEQGLLKSLAVLLEVFGAHFQRAQLYLFSGVVLLRVCVLLQSKLLPCLCYPLQPAFVSMESSSLRMDQLHAYSVIAAV
jgi:hypothetical protein